MTKKIIISILIIPFLFVGLVQAQTNDLPDPGMLPDSLFYFLKSWTEGIGTVFTFGEGKKAERFLNLSEKRLAEAKALIERGSMEHATRTIERYEEQLERAMQRAERGKEKGLDTDKVLERISERTLKHQEVLADVYERVPEEAREGIERAMENSMRGHEESLRAVSGERREEVMERVRTKREEVESKIEEMRSRGIDIPQILEREGITPDISTEPGMLEEREVPETSTPQIPGQGEKEEMNETIPEALETPREQEEMRPEIPETPETSVNRP